MCRTDVGRGQMEGRGKGSVAGCRGNVPLSKRCLHKGGVRSGIKERKVESNKVFYFFFKLGRS